MTETLTVSEQAEKLRRWVSRVACYNSDTHSTSFATAGGQAIRDNGTIFAADNREYEITVQPKGLAELQAGLIDEVRNGTFGLSLAAMIPGAETALLAAIRAEVDKYDAALASLGVKDGGGQ